MDLQSLLGDGGVAGVFLYLVFRDLIKPKYNKAKFSKPEYNRRRSDNPGPVPGDTQICRENHDKIIRLEGSVESLEKANEKEHKQINDSISKLFELWDKLKLRRR